MATHPVASNPDSFCSQNETASSATEKNDQSFIDSDLALATRDHLRRWCENLSTAAHDLKTPLSVLGGYIDLLLEEKVGGLNACQREMLSDMKQNEARLQRFIKDFITFSEFQRSPLQLNLRVSDLTECITDIAAVWDPLFREKHVRIRVVTDPTIAPFAFNYYKVQHVISNMLDNALKFSPPRTTVRIQASAYNWERRSHRLILSASLQERRRAASATPNSARVSVTDAGPGIPPEFHRDIFRDFYRLESHDKPHGTGLGLAIARRLIHLHGGTIWVESELGKGCKFTFLLPVHGHASRSDSQE